MLDTAYLAVAARRAGVPEMWIDDAISDIWLRCWLANDWRKIVVRRAAVDTVRRYGPYSRYGVSRETVEIDNKVPVRSDPYAAVDRCLDFAAAWQRMTPAQQRILIRASNGRRAHVSHQRVYEVRRKLRRLVAVTAARLTANPPL